MTYEEALQEVEKGKKIYRTSWGSNADLPYVGKINPNPSLPYSFTETNGLFMKLTLNTPIPYTPIEEELVATDWELWGLSNGN